ncbi:MAG TPA: hypothetical protein VKQ36_00495 [Ktedonobacterales bacterium]|nr:hypothetical protein [Ktedonobacterales bacterium]
MNVATLALMRRIATISSLAGAALIVVGGFLTGITYLISFLGALLAIVGWGVGVWIALANRRTTWLVTHAYFALAAVITLVLAFTQLRTADEQITTILVTTFMPLAIAGLASGIISSDNALSRGTPATFGAAALILLITGGLAINDTVGANAAAPNTIRLLALGYHLYMVTGILALVAWIIGMIVAVQTRAWGWFAMTVLMPGIGAFMFGLFGPSAADVRQARENAAARRAAGVRV